MRIVYLFFMAVVYVFAQSAQNNTVSSDDEVIEDPLIDEILDEEEDERDYYKYSFDPSFLTYADTYDEFCDTKTGK